MIKLERPPEPQKLIDNKPLWLKKLLDAIVQHGSYSAIPRADREKLIAHYRDDAILNSPRLLKPRADILIELTVFIVNVENVLNDYSVADSAEKQQKLFRNLRESILIVESFKEPDKRYAGFCRYFLNNSDSYKKAKSIVAD
jgi:hypothetical protein